MITLNKTRLISIYLFIGMSTSAIAMENKTTMCVHDSQTRIIEIVYTGENAVPCDVQYTKAEETKTLWSAQNQVGYCESKATAFVEKQIGWGWSCDLVDTNTDIKAEAIQ